MPRPVAVATLRANDLPIRKRATSSGASNGPASPAGPFFLFVRLLLRVPLAAAEIEFGSRRIARTASQCGITLGSALAGRSYVRQNVGFPLCSPALWRA